MFDKEKFSNILKEINSKYNNMTEFAEKADFDRSYISKYIHQKLNNPPTPKILMGISNASKGSVNYYELMEICGYVEHEEIIGVKNSLTHPTGKHIYTVPILCAENGNLVITREDVLLPDDFDNKKQYFGYRATDDSMLPLLGVDDIAIVEKTNTYKSGNTCIISIDNKDVIIRKIIDFNNYIELQTAFPYGQTLKLTKDEMIKRNFTILGKIIKTENRSAFR